jgi:hypothetical protein
MYAITTTCSGYLLQALAFKAKAQLHKQQLRVLRFTVRFTVLYSFTVT